MGEGLAEWIITAPDGREMMLQMSYFDRGHRPVIMDIGPVLDLDDVLGGKVAALASRAAERDYIDVDRRPGPRLQRRAAHRPRGGPGPGPDR